MVSRQILIRAPAEKCYAVITDYKKYPQFLTRLKEVEVKKKRGNSCEVTYHLRLIMEITYTLMMKGRPFTGVEWSFVSGNIMKDNHGFWELKEVKKGQTRVIYNLEVELGLFVPSAIAKMLLEQSLPEMLAAFKKRIESVN